MKKLVMIAAAVLALQACNSDSSKGEQGVVNDGIKTVDTNGALNEGHPLTDSTNNPVENKTRTDIQQRDTFTTKGQ